jgi:transposase-like protein
MPADRRGRPRVGDLRLHVGELGAPDRIDRGEAEGLTSEERARLQDLERENARLRMERDLLKRTVAFWVKEQSTP